MNEKILVALKETMKDLCRCSDHMSAESYNIKSANGEDTWIKFRLDECKRVKISLSHENIELSSNVVLHLDAWSHIVKDDELFKREFNHIMSEFHNSLSVLSETVDIIGEVA